MLPQARAEALAQEFVTFAAHAQRTGADRASVYRLAIDVLESVNGEVVHLQLSWVDGDSARLADLADRVAAELAYG